jgi:hypothetical protein
MATYARLQPQEQTSECLAICSRILGVGGPSDYNLHNAHANNSLTGP